MQRDLHDKVFLVTGATEGIGKVAAERFAERGAILSLVARNRDKGERLVADLRQRSGNPHIELLVGDLSLRSEVRAVAAAFRARHQRLDVLVNNAGAIFVEHRLTSEGLERTFALNHLGYFLLTRELWDLLKSTPGSRVVSTASRAHQGAKLDLDLLPTRPSGKAGLWAYKESKLANILFTRELGRRIGPEVAVSCFHPGFVRTGFGLNNRGLFRAGIDLAARLVGRTPERGAATLIWLATSPEAAQPAAQYYFDGRLGRTSRAAQDDAMAGRLWELSERLCAAGS